MSGDANGMSVEDARMALAGRDESVRVIDIRRLDEFGDGHIPGALNVEDGDAEAVVSALDDLDRDEDERVLVVCAQGKRSREVASELSRRDLDVAYLDGGMKAWGREQPVEPPESDTEYEGPKKKSLY